VITGGDSGIGRAVAIAYAREGQGVRLLLAGNALHADIPLDGSGSGFLGLLLIMLGQTVGFPVPEGGADKLAEAMRDRFLRHGGAVVCNAEATKITVEHGRAVGVQVHDQLVRARRAVLADVAAEHLYGRLVTFDELPSKVRARMAGFRRDPGTVKVDFALSSPVPWSASPPYAPGTVHVSDSYEELVIGNAQLSTGHIPEQSDYTDPRALPGLVLSAPRRRRARRLRHERGTRRVGTRATCTAPCRLRATFGQVGEPAQCLAVAYVDASHSYRLRNQQGHR